MKKYIIFILFILILLIAIFFRCYQLSKIPPSPSLDEVSIGYNAYSILNTGKDEYGYHFPLLLRAYDDWRPALYVYMVIPFVKLFGLTVFAVRLPSVLLSFITIAATYFLVKELFNKNKEVLALISMLLLAISPWHIYISRLGHEVNAGSTCIVLAALFFLIAMHHTKKNWFLYLSAALFGISFYTYQSEKIFTPLIILVLVLFFWKNLFAIKIQTLVAFCVFIFITIPVFTVSVSPVGLTRLKGTSAFNHLDTMYAESAKQVLLAKKQGNFFEEIIHNRRIIPIKIFLENYFSHMNPFWLYGNNGADAFKAPQFGLFFWWELFFLLSGIFFIVKNSVDKKVQWFMYSWIAISFVAPGITTQAPHAMRAFTVLPMPFVIESYGILGIWLLAKTYIQRIFFISICLFTLIVGLYGFSYQYFFVFPKKESKPFSYALSQAMQFLINTKAENNKIIISNTDNLYQSYMFYLFAIRYNPRTYLQQGGSVSGGFAQTHKIKNIEFRPIVWEKEKKKQGMLYLGNPSDFPANVSIIQKFYYLDGTEGVWLVKP